MRPSTEALTGDGQGLSPEDVESLLIEEGPAPRIRVLGKIAARYNERLAGPRQARLAEEVFRLLMHDTEVEVRAALAKSIKDNPYIPRDVVMRMVEDVESVALPVLRSSDVLSVDDLVPLVESGVATSRMAAIATRRTVPEEVSAALAEKGDAEVVAKLLGNPGALVGEASYGRVLDRFEGYEAIIMNLGSRPGLPLAVVEKLIATVSETLADRLKEKYRFSDQAITVPADRAREQATLSLLKINASREEVGRLVSQLCAHGRMTPSLLAAALCRGNIAFFELGLARLARVPAINAHALFNDRGELGYQALYAKAGMPERLFAALRLVLNIARENEEVGLIPDTPGYADRMAERILYFTEGKTIEGIPHILALVRQGR